MADPDLQIRGGGAVIQTLRSALDQPLYSTYIAKDNKLKILAVEGICAGPIWSEKKIDHLHQQSAILLLQAQTLGLRLIGKSGFRYWYLHFGFCHQTRNLNTDLPSSSYDQLLLPKSQTFTHSQVKGLATKHTNKQYLLLHFYKTLKKANLQINPSYAVGNEPVCP